MHPDSLKKAKLSAPPQGSLQPLVEQLEKIAKDLRGAGNVAEAEKIEKAASSIQAAATTDLTIIDRATTTVSKQVRHY